MRGLREQAGMSQGALADAMRDLGHLWHQQTVARVERGTQGVRWAEACALAAILNTSLDRLTWGSAEANTVAFLATHTASVVRSGHQAAQAVARLLLDQDRGLAAAAQHEESESQRVRDAAADLLAAVREWDLDGAVSAGVRQHAELAEDTDGETPGQPGELDQE